MHLKIETSLPTTIIYIWPPLSKMTYKITQGVQWGYLGFSISVSPMLTALVHVQTASLEKQTHAIFSIDSYEVLHFSQPPPTPGRIPAKNGNPFLLKSWIQLFLHHNVTSHCLTHWMPIVQCMYIFLKELNNRCKICGVLSALYWDLGVLCYLGH